MPPPARCARSAAPGAAASKCECGGAEGRARSAGLARPDAESAAGAANAGSAAASQSMPKGRAAYSSRAAGSLPARRQGKRGRLAGVLGHARRRPRYGRRRIANKECGARVGRKKKPPKGAGAQSSFSAPPPPPRSERAAAGFNARRDAAPARRAPQGPASVPRPAAPPSRQLRRPARGSRMRAPRALPCGGRALLGCAPAATWRPKAAGLLFWAGPGAGRAGNGRWRLGARSSLSPRGRPDVAAVRAGSRARNWSSSGYAAARLRLAAREA